MEKGQIVKDEKGLSTVEYIIILALVAVSGIGLWNQFGETVSGKVKSSGNVVKKDLSTTLRE